MVKISRLIHHVLHPSQFSAVKGLLLRHNDVPHWERYVDVGFVEQGQLHVFLAPWYIITGYDELNSWKPLDEVAHCPLKVGLLFAGGCQAHLSPPRTEKITATYVNSYTNKIQRGPAWRNVIQLHVRAFCPYGLVWQMVSTFQLPIPITLPTRRMATANKTCVSGKN